MTDVDDYPAEAPSTMIFAFVYHEKRLEKGFSYQRPAPTSQALLGIASPFRPSSNSASNRWGMLSMRSYLSLVTLILE